MGWDQVWTECLNSLTVDNQDTIPVRHHHHHHHHQQQQQHYQQHHHQCQNATSHVITKQLVHMHYYSEWISSKDF